MSTKYLTVSEVVERFRGVVSPETLAVWRSHKKGPPYTKIGGRVLYPVDSLEKWEEENKNECK